MVNQPNASLVKYDTPILVSTAVGKKGTKQKTLPPIEKAATTRNEDYLNSILPPREYTEKGQLWVQYVSPIPATKMDVINLQDELDKRLQQRQARETGICPIREELYAQAFDEIIREITINCAERGFLLVRVRDEIKMTIQAYQTLYESSIAFGMRKALQAEQRQAEMLMKIQDLEENCELLEREVDAHRDEIAEMLRKEKDEKENEEVEHQEEIKGWLEKTQGLKEQVFKKLTTLNLLAPAS